MSRDEFFRTYFTGQKELALMAAMVASERARFLSKVLGYEKLRLAQDIIGDRRRTLSSEIVGLRAGMPDPEAVERATGVRPLLPDRLSDLMERKETIIVLPNEIRAVADCLRQTARAAA